MADEAKHSLLERLKLRLAIFHTKQDSELTDELNASQQRIKQIVGSDDITDPIIAELVIERVRYAYYDQLEYFEQNFQNELISASINRLEASDDANPPTEEL